MVLLGVIIGVMCGVPIGVIIGVMCGVHVLMGVICGVLMGVIVMFGLVQPLALPPMLRPGPIAAYTDVPPSANTNSTTIKANVNFMTDLLGQRIGCELVPLFIIPGIRQKNYVDIMKM
jgi:hypothetical protein